MARSLPLTPAEAIAQLPLARFTSAHRPGSTSATNPPRATVAAILDALALAPGQRVLQIGLGSGYVSAVILACGGRLIGVERMASLAKLVDERLRALALGDSLVEVGDGARGWPATAPYDRILVMARGITPEPLVQQLAPGGRLVALAGTQPDVRELIELHRDPSGLVQRRSLGNVRVRTDLADLLVARGLLDEANAGRYRMLAARGAHSLQEVLQHHAHIDEREICRAIAEQDGLQVRSIGELLATLDLAVAQAIPRAYLDHHHLLPLGYDERGELLVATCDPNARVDEVSHVFPGATLVAVLVTQGDWRRLWSSLDQREASRPVEIEATPHETDGDMLLQPGGEDIDTAAGVLEAILREAVAERASDIHLECYGERARVRFRVDGELHDQPRFVINPRELVALVNVIKVRAHMDIAERRLPQGGRIRLRAGDLRFDLRIQTQPSLLAEHVVIRLLPQDAETQTIEEIGFPPAVAAAYRRLLDSPSGLVLVVGPTGSGKSTTLYAGLRKLAADARRKVITVEDPIEYSIANVQQTAVRPRIGFAFADAMRSFVRQDPDVILVGEIRDQETALEAIRASQTGHLVLSTLHCNDAVDAVQRLYDLGMHPNSIASELLAVFSQRLAKRVCPACRVQVEPDPATLRELFPAGAPADFACYYGRGCEVCGGLGTRGRIAVVEFLHVTADVRRAISRRPALDDLRELARGVGLIPLRDALVDQIKAGVVPLSDAPRLLQADAMAG